MPGFRHRLARKRSYNGRERVYRRPIRRALTAAQPSYRYHNRSANTTVLGNIPLFGGGGGEGVTR